MNMKTSRFGACFSAIKINMTRFVIGNSRADSTRSIVGEQPIMANKEMSEENNGSGTKKSMLSEMGDKLCLSKWSAFK